VCVEVGQEVQMMAFAFEVCAPSLASDCLSWFGGDFVVAFDAELVGVT